MIQLLRLPESEGLIRVKPTPHTAYIPTATASSPQAFEGPDLETPQPRIPTLNTSSKTQELYQPQSLNPYL